MTTMNRNNTSFTARLSEMLKALPTTKAYLKYYQMITSHVFQSIDMDTRGLLVMYQMGRG